MERALLDGEQQIELEQLDTLREKVTCLEAKETKLLAETDAGRQQVLPTTSLIFYRKHSM